MGDSSEAGGALRKARYLEEFFGRYKGFTFDTEKPAMTEFRRLCEERGWKEKSGSARKAHSSLKRALVEQFRIFYGISMGDTRAWKSLCWACGVDPIPTSAEVCVAVMTKIHVNLVDLVDVQRVQMRVQTFKTVAELQAYTIEQSKFFPRYVAEGDELLRHLVRRLQNPQGRWGGSRKKPKKPQRNSGPDGSSNNNEGETGQKKKRRRRRRKNKKTPTAPKLEPIETSQQQTQSATP